jgi:hypothetical protein
VPMSGTDAAALRVPSLIRAGTYLSPGGSRHERLSIPLAGKAIAGLTTFEVSRKQSDGRVRRSVVSSRASMWTSSGGRPVVRVSESDLAPSETATPFPADHGLSRSQLTPCRPGSPSFSVSPFHLFEMVDIPENERIPSLPWVES